MFQLYKYQPINGYVLSNLAQKKIWHSKPDKFNDPFEFRLQRNSKAKGIEKLREENPHLANLSDEKLIELAIEKYEQEMKSMGISCFTELPENIQMWAYYADSHQGICLGFCGANEKASTDDVGLYKVNYELDYPELTFSDIWHKDGMAKILWTKEKAWEHEKEWRLIRVKGDELVDYAKITLNKVIFGCRTSENYKNLIRKILKDDEGVGFFQVRMSDTKYELKIDPDA